MQYSSKLVEREFFKPIVYDLSVNMGKLGVYRIVGIRHGNSDGETPHKAVLKYFRDTVKNNEVVGTEEAPAAFIPHALFPQSVILHDGNYIPRVIQTSLESTYRQPNPKNIIQELIQPLTSLLHGAEVLFYKAYYSRAKIEVRGEKELENFSGYLRDEATKKYEHSFAISHETAVQLAQHLETTTALCMAAQAAENIL